MPLRASSASCACSAAPSPRSTQLARRLAHPDGNRNACARGPTVAHAGLPTPLPHGICRLLGPAWVRCSGNLDRLGLPVRANNDCEDVHAFDVPRVRRRRHGLTSTQHTRLRAACSAGRCRQRRRSAIATPACVRLRHTLATSEADAYRDRDDSIQQRRPPAPWVGRTPAISCEAVAPVPSPRGHAAAPCVGVPGAAASLVSFMRLFDRIVHLLERCTRCAARSVPDCLTLAKGSRDAAPLPTLARLKGSRVLRTTDDHSVGYLHHCRATCAFKTALPIWKPPRMQSVSREGALLMSVEHCA